ncbi:hypothetical protein LTR04_006857 [Oleoguttula sp. CCFEE 6159]|nr:hypothetical protein LTR04_006857 [Oleoguttula sp. CCFEE 6159]
MNIQRADVLIPRTVICTIMLTAIATPSIYERLIQNVYAFLLSSPFYRLSFVETIEIFSLYALLEPIYTYRFAHNPSLRIDVRPQVDDDKPSSAPKLPRLRRPTKRLLEIGKSIAPLLLLDLILIKKYSGVSVPAIRQSGNYDPYLGSSGRIKATFLAPTLHNFSWDSPLQLHRALPQAAPSSRRLVLELLVAFFLYDALFFFIHIAFHKIPVLRRIHHPHHTHAEINPQVTNQLSIVERVSLIMMANFALNIIGSHVLTRTLFVPFFVYLLIEVHSGLDLPWGYDKIMPWRMGAGSRRHAVHHRVGEGSYQPFFCWWDDALLWFEGKNKAV